MPSEEQTYRQRIDEKLSLILTQTTATNGRVNKLERWQSYVIGFCAAVSMLLLPVLFMLLNKLI